MICTITTTTFMNKHRLQRNRDHHRRQGHNLLPYDAPLHRLGPHLMLLYQSPSFTPRQTRLNLQPQHCRNRIFARAREVPSWLSQRGNW